MNNEIREQITEFITTNFLFDDSIKLSVDDSLLETGVIDSTGVLELVAFIEEKYEINVEDEEIIPENLDSIQNITIYISQKLSQASANQAVN